MKRTIHLLHDSPELTAMLVIDEHRPPVTKLPPPPALPRECRPTVRPGLAKVIDMPARQRRSA